MMAKRIAESSLDALAEDLLAIAGKLGDRVAGEPPAGTSAKRIRERLLRVKQQLSQSIEALDPVRQPTAFFDPTNPSVLGRW